MQGEKTNFRSKYAFLLNPNNIEFMCVNMKKHPFSTAQIRCIYVVENILVKTNVAVMLTATSPDIVCLHLKDQQ